ncbi:hypothetical protein IG631_08066 [Alternaria alternata]|nr:hypothetical protein IG631_08066 [Alternaria alternata]
MQCAGSGQSSGMTRHTPFWPLSRLPRDGYPGEFPPFPQAFLTVTTSLLSPRSSSL